MSRLPEATHQEPACGACGADTRVVDSDWYECEDCCLYFDSDTLAASFADPDVEMCGEPCDNSWHGDNKIRQGLGFDCNPCQLPAGHTSMHWTGCQSKGISRAATPVGGGGTGQETAPGGTK